MNVIDAQTLNSECHDRALPWRVEVVDEITSTNDALRELAQKGSASDLVLFAESQTAGRGRRDHRWVTPRGLDLMFSLLMRPTAPVPLWPRYTTLAALAVCLAIEKQLPLKPHIKWPNDLYLNELKISGLLAEVVSTAHGTAFVLGIGLNVNTLDFPPDLSATSLLKELKTPLLRELDRQSLAVAILEQLHGQFQRIELGYHEAVGEVRSRSWLLGKQIRATVDGNELFGRAVDLNAEGHLLVALRDGSVASITSAEGVRQVL